jgi:mannosyl-3-phosphoglycerate phosphatase
MVTTLHGTPDIRYLLIFTDLDGSLLDAEDYSFAGARPALDLIARERWPLIFVTSKTRSEVEALQKAMGLDAPYVVENGAAAYFPARQGSIPGSTTVGRYRALVFGRPYEEIRAFLLGIAAEFGLCGFGDMTVAEIAERTALPLEDAERAKQREYTEPFVIRDSDRLPELERTARQHGLAITTGGRLHHLMAASQSKGRAVRKVREILARQASGPVETVGLGDSPNDLDMLEAVDHPIVIPRTDGWVLEVPRSDVRRAPGPGSRGWSAAVLDLVEAL